MGVEGSQRVSHTDTTLQQRAVEAPKSKGKWYRFSVSRLISNIKSFFQGWRDRRLVSKTLHEFKISPLPVTVPHLSKTEKADTVQVKKLSGVQAPEARKLLNEWGGALLGSAKLRQKNSGKLVTRQWLEQIAYSIYEDDKPKGVSKLRKNQKWQLAKYLEGIHRKGKAAGFRVSPQSDDDRSARKQRSPGKLNRSESQNEFAFRFMPFEDRQVDAPVESRMTLNFHPQFAPFISDLLAELVADDCPFRDLVHQAKILGPSELGNRTDAAVLYLGDNPDKAQELAQYIHNKLGDKILVDHIPGGMLPLQPGIGYAETREGDSSSYGESRSEMLAEAVMRVWENPSLNLETVLSKTLEAHGYDPANPALVLRDKTPANRA